jgi:chromosome segregation ATPase
MSQIPGLRMLVKLKERRLVQLDEATKLHQQRLGEQIGALNAVLEEERGCRGQEAAQRERLHALSTGTQGFRASDVVTLHGLLADAEQRVVAAAKRTRQAEQQVEAANEALRQARQDQRRGEQQRDKCKERLRAALEAIEREQEDQQDEESEEASVARMLMRASAERVAAEAGAEA